MSKWLLSVLLFGALGCSRGGYTPSADPDLAGGKSEDGGAEDLRMAPSEEDLAGRDLKSAADLAPSDLRQADLMPAPDLAFSPTADVDIFVDNFCKMDVVPKNFTVPAGAILKLTYRNRSKDYPVDVWLSYGGGFLDLKQGMLWADRFEHCAGPMPSTAYADITTACSRYRLIINCL